jgi:hypothetical protein
MLARSADFGDQARKTEPGPSVGIFQAEFGLDGIKGSDENHTREETVMKKASILVATVLLGAGIAVGAPLQAQNPCNPCSKKAKNPCNPCSKSAKVKGGGRTIIGYIGDEKCGLNHPMGMGDAKTCTLKCVGMGSKFILADRSHKVVYALDDAGQAKAKEFAGQKVRVTGRVDASTKTIHVEKIAKG